MNDYEYKGYWICRIGENPGIWRVKSDQDASFALHHGSFSIATEAENWIDRNLTSKNDTCAQPQYREPTLEDAWQLKSIQAFSALEMQYALKQLGFVRKVQP